MIRRRASRVLGRVGGHARRLSAAVASMPRVRCRGAVDVAATIRSDESAIRGWALARDVRAVLVIVDGEPRVARLGIERPDVARARTGDPSARSSGWEVVVDLGGMAGRTIEIEVCAVTGTGLAERVASRHVDVVAAPVYRFDDPLDGWEVHPGFVPVWGTALGPEVVTRIDVAVDGVPIGPARLHAGPTPHLRRSPLPGSPLAYFSSMVDLRGRAPGSTVEISAAATLRSGTTVAIGPVVATVRSPAWPPAPATPPHLGDGSNGVASPLGSGRAPVLFVVAHDLGMGGAQLYLLDVLTELRARTDWRFVVVAPRDARLRGAYEAVGAVVHLVGEYPITDPVAYEAQVRALQSVLLAEGCAAVLASTTAAAIGADVGHRTGVPVMWMIHESFRFDEFFVAMDPPFGAHPAIGARMRAALAESDAVVFEADATRRLYEDDVDPRRFVTIPFGVATRAFGELASSTDRAELRRDHGIADDETVVLSMGLIEPRKAQAALVTAFAAIADDHPSAVVVLVGDGGDAYSAAVREHADRLGIGARVRFVPVVDDSRPWFVMADLLVHPSDLESMPRSVLEAMAFGCPVLLADAFGARELVSHGVDGWVFPPRDVTALRDALDRVLWLAPAERAAIAVAGRERVRSAFDFADYADAMVGLFRRVTTMPDAPSPPHVPAGP